jgi:hypothetical protein
MKKLLKITLGAVCMAGLLALPFQASAILLTIGDADPYYLGSIRPGNPAGQTDEEGYIDQLRTQALSTLVTSDQQYTRSDNVFGSLPAAEFAVKFAEATLENPFTLPDGFVYLLAKYGNDGTGQASHVWVISGLTGEISLPDTTGEGLSHVTLFNKVYVPDGGTTLLLLGAAMAGVAALRRKLA